MSAQQRIYWTNIQTIKIPDNKNILLKDILNFGIKNLLTDDYIEKRKMQTLPKGYTKYGIFNNEEKRISDNQRYKAIGNGWIVDVICHILKEINNE